MTKLLPVCTVFLILLCMAPCACAEPGPGAGNSEPLSYTGFSHPAGISADPSGAIYATDLYSDSVWKFSPDGTMITHWGSEGGGNGQFIIPGAVATGSDRFVHVADINNNRIQKFSSDGSYVSAWKFPVHDYLQCSRKPLIDPLDQCWDTGIHAGGIAPDPEGNLFVIDAWNMSVLKISPEGKILAMWGSKGSEPGQFDKPHDIAVDPEGNVLVTDGNNGRVQKFSPAGKFLASFGTKGTARGQFDSPGGIAVDRQGFIYVTEFYQDRVQKFSGSGTFVTAWGSSGTEDGEFDGPIDVTADDAGNIYVADFGNHRIQKFTADGTFLLKWGGTPAPTPVPTTRPGCKGHDETWMNLTPHLIDANENQNWGFSEEEMKQYSEKLQAGLDNESRPEPGWVHVCYAQFSRDVRDTLGITEEQRIALLYYEAKSRGDGFLAGEGNGYIPAKTPRYEVSGTITDPAGRPVPDATVRFESDLVVRKISWDLVDEDTRLTSTTQTGADGRYHIRSVWGTMQNITVTKAGYVPTVRPGVNLTCDTSYLNFPLAPETTPAPATPGFLVGVAITALMGAGLLCLRKRKEQ